MGNGVDGTVRAAGAVLWRQGQRGLEVALVHRPKYDDWSLPKGKLSAGEHLLEAAVREVDEETGHRVRLGRPLPEQRYPVDGRPKTVRYWAAQADPDGRHEPTAEVDAIEWLPPGIALRRLTHDRDRDLLDAFLGGPISTVPLLLVRHAAAVPRAAWADDDTDRPLDPAGVAQAEALAPLLEAYGVARLLSSDSRRCVETVMPYAKALRVTVEAEPLLSEAGFAAHRPAALARAERLLAVTTPTAVCSHRPVLPPVVETLCDLSGVDAPAGGLEAGGFWALHLSEGRIVAVEGHGP